MMISADLTASAIFLGFQALYKSLVHQPFDEWQPKNGDFFFKVILILKIR